ncbi:MAG: ral secretion pathway protein [Pseudomonadota bacterium]|nr:ral secretion pathway protein [Pseudomonadota bacterium]
MADRKPFRFRWPHYLLAVLVYLALLLAWAPASLLAWALPQLTRQAVQLDQAQGSLWRGQAAGVRVRAARGTELQLGGLTWRLKPGDLFSGRLGYRLELAGAGVDAAAVLRASAKGVELRDLRAAMPANWLEQVSPELGLWQPGGRLLFESSHLAIGRAGSIDGQGTLRWLEAASGLVRSPLGSYRADIEGADTALELKLATESGPLFLQGSGKWTPRGGLAFNGAVRAAPENRAEFDGLLGLVGPAQADGSRTIRIGR